MFRPRTTFPPHEIPLANFANHHANTLKQLKSLAPKVDLVLELRDCRAPLSSINPLLDKALFGIKKIVLYTKKDIGKVKQSLLLPIHNDIADEFRMVSVDERKFASRLLREIRDMADQQHPKPPLGFNVLLTGMPNSGKSTFINQFRRIIFGKQARKVARTGNLPGVTRKISEKIRVCEDPDVFVIDTPGVMMPQVRDWEHMIRLCLIGAVPRNLVDPVILADYILFHMNLQYPLGGRYPGPLSNDINQVLWNIANTMRRKPRKDEWDPSQTASEWVDRYINGGIGKVSLDFLTRSNIEEQMRLIYGGEHERSEQSERSE